MHTLTTKWRRAAAFSSDPFFSLNYCRIFLTRSFFFSFLYFWIYLFIL